jgi:hypothetical protein
MLHSNFFFWAKLVRNGRIRAVKFRPKNVGRNFADLGEFPPNTANFWLEFGRNSPKSKKIRPQIFGRNLTARIRPFSGEQELLCIHTRQAAASVLLFF